LEKKANILLFMYTLLVVLSIISLYLLGEKRVDVYVSLNILAYYVSYAVARPSYTSRPVRILNIALFVIFTLIVALRIYEVLMS